MKQCETLISKMRKLWKLGSTAKLWSKITKHCKKHCYNSMSAVTRPCEGKHIEMPCCQSPAPSHRKHWDSTFLPVPHAPPDYWQLTQKGLFWYHPKEIMKVFPVPNTELRVFGTTLRYEFCRRKKNWVKNCWIPQFGYNINSWNLDSVPYAFKAKTFSIFCKFRDLNRLESLDVLSELWISFDFWFRDFFLAISHWK